MMHQKDSILIKLTLDLPLALSILNLRQEMTQGMSSGQLDYQLIKRMKQFCLSINAPRKTQTNFILQNKIFRLYNILIRVRNHFNALIGPMTQKLNQMEFNNQNFYMCHVIIYTHVGVIQTIQFMKNAYLTLKLNNNILNNWLYPYILMKKS